MLEGLTAETDVQAHLIKATVASTANLMSGQSCQMKFVKLQAGAVSIHFQNLSLRTLSTFFCYFFFWVYLESNFYFVFILLCASLEHKLIFLYHGLLNVLD